jgi:hypothetical protein
MKRWREVVAPLLKSHQIILKITASCNKRMKRINTLIISSMKLLLKRAPFIGRLMEGTTEAPPLYQWLE